MTLQSAISYIEQKAARMRLQADQPGERFTSLRNDATVLEAVASDLRAGMHLEFSNHQGNGGTSLTSAAGKSDE